MPTITTEELQALAKLVIQTRIVTFVNLFGEFGRKIKTKINRHRNLIEIYPNTTTIDIFVRWKNFKNIFDECISVSVVAKDNKKSIEAIGKWHGIIVTINIHWKHDGE